METLTIGKLAEKANVGVETIRFYERKGLIKKPTSKVGSFRVYPHEFIAKINFIKKAQELGFTLSEVKELFDLNTKPRVTCGTVKAKTLTKIEEIKMKISDLERMKSSLEKLACACDASQDSIKQYKVQECFEIGLNCDC